MGVIRRQCDVLMIVLSEEPVSTGFQWMCCLLPTIVEGLIMTFEEDQNARVEFA